MDRQALIRPCTADDVPAIHAIINEAAEAYRGVIPDDCWHDPYMTHAALLTDIAAGVNFRGYEDSPQPGNLCGVMGLQTVKDATLIRHAYVKPAHQGKGVGTQLLAQLTAQASGTLLVGTWAAAVWAIRLYEKNGFQLQSPEDKDCLLDTYWTISPRQRETSVVLRYVSHLR